MKRYEAVLKEPKLSPMMRQYCEIHLEYADYLLLFRLGDFYELFFEDAEIAAGELELVLTARDAGMDEKVPMCGMPYHAVESYINRLTAKGYKLAICDQVEDPATAKGIVKREITGLITPGTRIEPGAYAADSNSWLLALYQEKHYYGIAVLELLSGQFKATQINLGNTDLEVLNELLKYRACEYLLPQSMQDSLISKRLDMEGLNITYRELSAYDFKEMSGAGTTGKTTFARCLPNDFNEKYPLAARAVCALLNYVNETQRTLPEHIQPLDYYERNSFLQIDDNVAAGLEIFTTIREQKKKGSLFWAINQTMSNMGARLLKQWLARPLRDIAEIQERQQAVKELKADFRLRRNLRERIRSIYDLERLAGKLGNGNMLPRDLLALAETLEILPDLQNLLMQAQSSLLRNTAQGLELLPGIVKLIKSAINPDCSNIIKDGNIILAGFNEEVDELRNINENCYTWFDNFVKAEKAKTGIRNMKVGYNRTFGYYLEVSKLNLDLVPEHYIRKQTLVNYERYITEELKLKEDQVLNAKQNLYELETALFARIKEEVKCFIDKYQHNAYLISMLDVIQSFAEQADLFNYCQPEFTEGKDLCLKAMRHPVLERLMGPANFVANDCEVDADSFFSLITGPNMAGKSTYMRQVALLVILAQCGSFVPASACKLSLVDKIFTRIGASDDLGLGLSTFMVEMKEMADILKNMTSDSLLILDEIGRGTSTADGLAIAWSLIEILNQESSRQARTFFATHYHELIDLAKTIKTMRNYHIAVAEENGEVSFLHKIAPGGTDQSYGVEVAKLAGLPPNLISRAEDIMQQLLRQNYKQLKLTIRKKREEYADQLNLFMPRNQAKESLIEDLRKLDINMLSPMDALHKLHELSEAAKKIT